MQKEIEEPGGGGLGTARTRYIAILVLAIDSHMKKEREKAIGQGTIETIFFGASSSYSSSWGTDNQV